MDQLEFIYKRHSVRNFTDEPVKEADLQAIFKAATYAPSGKNRQNWHFVVVKNKEKIAKIAELVTAKNAELAVYLPEDKSKALLGMAAYHTVFKKAPLLILAYAGRYQSVGDDLLAAGNMPAVEAEEYQKAHAGVQNVAAAMENLLLAAAGLGYGTCWMTGPTYAAKEITAYLGFDKPGYELVAMTPLGVPAPGNYANPARKPLEEVLTVIE